MLRFEWDQRKARENLRKHRVSFEEASSVFSDDEALLLDDPDHSTDEERFLLLGLSGALRLLTVVHCSRVDDEVIRVISPGGPPDLSAASMARGGCDEATVRFRESTEEPVRGKAQALGHDSPRRSDDRALKALAEETEIPYQTLINLYLRECAATGRKLALEWKTSRKGAA